MKSFQSTLSAITEENLPTKHSSLVPRVFSTFENGAAGEVFGRGAHFLLPGIARDTISEVTLVLDSPNDVHFGCKTFESYLSYPSLDTRTKFDLL